MLREIVKHIYPDITDSDFLLQDDGEGPYISYWNYSKPAPAQAQIIEATPVVVFNEKVKSFDAVIEEHLHAEATAHGYTNIERACMYASYPNPYWEESRSYVEWVGKVWAYCYQVLQEVENGIRPIPTVEELIAELPKRSLGETP